MFKTDNIVWGLLAIGAGIVGYLAWKKMGAKPDPILVSEANTTTTKPAAAAPVRKKFGEGATMAAPMGPPMGMSLGDGPGISLF